MGWSAGKQGFRGCVRRQEATAGEGIIHKAVRPHLCFAEAQPLSPEAGGKRYLCVTGRSWILVQGMLL